jgi:hypothetical protein
MATIKSITIGRGMYCAGTFTSSSDVTAPTAFIGPTIAMNIPAAGWSGGNIVLQMRPRLRPDQGGDGASNQIAWQTVATYTSASFANGALTVSNAGSDFEYQLAAQAGFSGSASIFIGAGQVQ